MYQAMKIKFINHSSIIIDTGKEKILCDPWYQGTAFANGWRLLCDDEININDLNFDKLWISHEHPDHFSIPTLKSLNSKKPVLYQKTNDKKVKKYLEIQGHEVTEMTHNKTYNINETKLTTIITEGYDSCILVDNGQHKFLNINDSQLDKENEIKKITKHTPIDLISIQFHYANWAGNIGDEEIPEFKRQNAVERIKKICQICKTNDVILFASFIYYAHEENFYWNKPFSHIDKTLKELDEAGINAIIMMPEDEIEVGNKHHVNEALHKNKESINFWKKKYDAIEIKEFSQKHQLSEIKEQYINFIDKINKNNNTEIFCNSFLKDFRLDIRITDHQKDLKIGLFEKSFKIESSNDKNSWDVSLSSEALSMLFQNDFSLGSITISSRLQFNYINAYKFYFFFLIPYRNNIGSYLTNSISKDLNFAAFKTNGVLKPIFKFNKDAEYEFLEFNKKLNTISLS